MDRGTDDILGSNSSDNSENLIAKSPAQHIDAASSDFNAASKDENARIANDKNIQATLPALSTENIPGVANARHNVDYFVDEKSAVPSSTAPTEGPTSKSLIFDAASNSKYLAPDKTENTQSSSTQMANLDDSGSGVPGVAHPGRGVHYVRDSRSVVETSTGESTAKDDSNVVEKHMTHPAGFPKEAVKNLDAKHDVSYRNPTTGTAEELKISEREQKRLDALTKRGFGTARDMDMAVHNMGQAAQAEHGGIFVNKGETARLDQAISSQESAREINDTVDVLKKTPVDRETQEKILDQAAVNKNNKISGPDINEELDDRSAS